jgi:hypothetical protein
VPDVGHKFPSSPRYIQRTGGALHVICRAINRPIVQARSRDSSRLPCRRLIPLESVTFSAIFFWKFLGRVRWVGPCNLKLNLGVHNWKRSGADPASTRQESNPASPVGHVIGFTHLFGGSSAQSAYTDNPNRCRAFPS